MQNDNEIIGLMVTLMKGTGKYVANRILVDEHKLAYVRGMKTCIHFVTTTRDLVNMKDAVISVNVNARQIYPATFFNPHKQEIKYAKMASQHALEIIEKLEARFITGTGDTDPRMFKDKGILIYKDEGLF
jgi:hypothetical protein